jgi:dTDP-4-dehydrorhamnose reductase/2-polyprenyl-3-methyl-5-hydroxy-6-metoxy-1,4-benzoquinol methylase
MKRPPNILIHAGGTTNKFNEDADEEYIRNNIIGTANVVLWCMKSGTRLVYISSDYVYPGERGDYSEESVLYPVNRYARSKLGGEMAVQLYDNSLIIRTSFYEKLDFEKACVDQYTSRIPIEEVGQAVYQLAINRDIKGIVNVGSRVKRSLYDIVKTEFRPGVEAARRADFRLPYLLPCDSSMDTSRFFSSLPTVDKDARSVNTCRICGAGDLVEYLNLGTNPLANSYLGEQYLAGPEYREELALRLCRFCGLSQLSKVVHPDRMFKNYLYVSSTTSTFREHCQELADTAIWMTGSKAGDWVLDIASNDGCLLSAFRERGMNVVGVDPAENLVREANAAGIRTLCCYWSPGVAQDIVSRFASPKIVTATNIVAHVDDVHRFVLGVERCLASRGIFIVECPYVLDFIEKNEFDTAYHEHLSYLGVHTLSRLMESHGMAIFDVEYFENIHGGTIRVFVSRTNDYAVTRTVRFFLEKERKFGIKKSSPYEAFASRVTANKVRLIALLEDLRRNGKRIWAYGASAKGNTLMNYCGISREMVPVVIDDNPKKWGLFTPGAHMRIVGIGELLKAEVDYLLLLSWNFEAEIRRRCQEAGYIGKFIMPVPDARIIENGRSK